jgi:hypothetical protein
MGSETSATHGSCDKIGSTMFTFSRRLPYSSIDWILQNYGADAAPQLLILQYEQTLAGQLTIDAEVENVSKLMWLRPEDFLVGIIWGGDWFECTEAVFEV